MLALHECQPLGIDAVQRLSHASKLPTRGIVKPMSPSSVQVHVLEHAWPGLVALGASGPLVKTGLLHLAQQHARTAALLLTTPGVLDEDAIHLLLRKASAVAAHRAALTAVLAESARRSRVPGIYLPACTADCLPQHTCVAGNTHSFQHGTCHAGAGLPAVPFACLHGASTQPAPLPQDRRNAIALVEVLGFRMDEVGSITSTARPGDDLSLLQAVAAAFTQLGDAMQSSLPHMMAGRGPVADMPRVARGLKACLPLARRLATALQAWWARPSQQRADQLELATAAATRSCAYLRCANLGGQGGPAAGQGTGSMQCR